MGLKTHPYIGGNNDERTRSPTDALPFSYFVVPVVIRSMAAPPHQIASPSEGRIAMTPWGRFLKAIADLGTHRVVDFEKVV